MESLREEPLAKWIEPDKTKQWFVFMSIGILQTFLFVDTHPCFSNLGQDTNLCSIDLQRP